jgi:hypothetical protein
MVDRTVSWERGFMDHKLDRVRLVVPIVDLVHLEGTISNLADLQPRLRVEHLDIEIQIVGLLQGGSLTELGKKLDQVLEMLTILQKGEQTIMADLNTLTDDVTQNTSVVKSAEALLTGLKTQLDAAIAANANGDPTKLAALSAQLEANTSELAAAVAANTPAAPPVA